MVIFFPLGRAFRVMIFFGEGDTLGHALTLLFQRGIRLDYRSPATALIFGRFSGFGVFVCSIKNHMLLIKWRTASAYCARATIFKRVFGRYTDKRTPFKVVYHSKNEISF